MVRRRERKPAILVLIVDDDPIVRQFLSEYLKKAGFAIRAVADSAEACDPKTLLGVAAVVLDVRMEGVNRGSGLSVLTFLRQESAFASVPVLILTGHVLTDEEEELIRRNHAYVFYKPHGYRVLCEYLQRLTKTTTPSSTRSQKHPARSRRPAPRIMP